MRHLQALESGEVKVGQVIILIIQVKKSIAILVNGNPPAAIVRLLFPLSIDLISFRRKVFDCLGTSFFLFRHCLKMLIFDGAWNLSPVRKKASLQKNEYSVL